MNRTIISKLNGFRFIEDGVTVSNPSYNHIDFDNSYYLSQIKEWESKDNYVQIAQHSDPIHLQVMSSVGSLLEIRAYDCNGQRVLNSPVPIYMQNVVNAPTVTVGQSSMTYYYFYSNDILSTLDSGVYHISIRVVYPNNDVVEYYSEPIHVKEKHKGSYFIRYKNRYNKDYVLFEQTGRYFNLRLPCDLEFVPAGDKVVFEDQQRNSYLLSGRAKRHWNLIIGGQGKYIPDYVVDILNHVFHVDTIDIDGVMYSVLDSSDLNVSKVNRYPLRSVNILLGERTDIVGHSSIIKPSNPLPPVVVAPPVNTFPSIRISPALTYNGVLQGVIGNPFLAEAVSDNGVYLVMLNSYINTQTDLGGSFSFINDSLVFTPALGDMIDAGTSNVLTNALEISVEAESPISISGTIEVSGGEDFSLTKNYEQPFMTINYDGSNQFDFKLDVDNGDTVQLWADNDIRSLVIKDLIFPDGVEGNLTLTTPPTSTCTINLTKFAITNSSGIIVSNIGGLMSCSFDLNTIILDNMIAIYSGSFSEHIVYHNITYLSFVESNIKDSAATDIIEFVYNNLMQSYLITGYYITNGTIDLRNNGLTHFEPHIESRAMDLINKYGWNIMLFRTDSIYLGHVSRANVCLESVNLCGIYEEVNLCFNTAAGMVGWLNDNYVVNNNLVGEFVLTYDGNVVYTNEDGLCSNGFLRTHNADAVAKAFVLESNTKTFVSERMGIPFYDNPVNLI